MIEATDPRGDSAPLRWLAVLRTGNLPEGADVDVVSKWLLITRACVFSMTLTSAAIGGLLAAATADSANWGAWALATFGLLLAHASNNMMNDYFDTQAGVDTPEYPRALYAPHPILSGLITREGLRFAIGATLILGAVVAFSLILVRGWWIAAFTAAGLFLSVFYVAPPLQLKHHGLGEPSVFVVWGPLMIGGTYYVAAGNVPPWVWLASLPYALIVMTVLIGKHIDKLQVDAQRGVRTLPVLLGEARSRSLNRMLMIAFYGAVVFLVLSTPVGLGVLLVAGALPRLLTVLQAYGEPKPDAPPAGFRVWPLWYVALAFHHNRLAGLLLVIGLLLNATLGL